MMVSGHYPMLTGHPHAWLLVALILVIGAMVRHFFNRHEAGDPLAKIGWTLPVAAFGLAAAMVMTAPKSTSGVGAAVVSDADVLAVAGAHCTACHAASPRHEAFDEAPNDIHLATLADLRRYRDQIMAQAVHSQAMPLGNETGMSADERQKLGAWLVSQ